MFIGSASDLNLGSLLDDVPTETQTRRFGDDGIGKDEAAAQRMRAARDAGALTAAEKQAAKKAAFEAKQAQGLELPSLPSLPSLPF